MWTQFQTTGLVPTAGPIPTKIKMIRVPLLQQKDRNEGTATLPNVSGEQRKRAGAQAFCGSKQVSQTDTSSSFLLTELELHSDEEESEWEVDRFFFCFFA